ncbi:TetR/AcrR family transcriptional regulator [Caulobacter mirabilis]|nr:TetR/AcrR family transcriptional regulator [Caulobacter mirabilis]
MTITQRQASERGPRRRRTPAEARDEALGAAEAILAREGPPGLTLQAVAAEAGMAHGNLTHHFGSSAGLQAALVVRMSERLAGEVAAATLRLRGGEATSRQIVDMVFDAMARDDHGRLVAWVCSTGQADKLAPVFEVIAGTVHTLKATEPAGGDPASQGAGVITAALLSAALSASLIGAPLQRAAGLADDALRDLAARQLDSLRVR